MTCQTVSTFDAKAGGTHAGKLHANQSLQSRSTYVRLEKKKIIWENSITLEVGKLFPCYFEGPCLLDHLARTSSQLDDVISVISLSGAKRDRESVTETRTFTHPTWCTRDGRPFVVYICMHNALLPSTCLIVPYCISRRFPRRNFPSCSRVTRRLRHYLRV